MHSCTTVGIALLAAIGPAVSIPIASTAVVFSDAPSKVTSTVVASGNNVDDSAGMQLASALSMSRRELAEFVELLTRGVALSSASCITRLDSDLVLSGEELDHLPPPPPSPLFVYNDKLAEGVTPERWERIKNNVNQMVPEQLISLLQQSPQHVRFQVYNIMTPEKINQIAEFILFRDPTLKNELRSFRKSQPLR
ncbi:hypothetical protein BC835DRAFT_1303362 [Cytidiella melzeri]|nr:hypothetical protein BC835DRAFT_1303362 [Cytidiella melzeri]